jgi:hypothetical protein
MVSGAPSNVLFDSLGPTDRSRLHGPDWTFADMPFHLTYFDRSVVVGPIERGSAVPTADQRVQRTFSELNAWNAEKFAERPADQTPELSLQEMRMTRDAIRRAIAGFDDAELGRPVFISLVGCGWLTAGAALSACLMHTWSHSVQLRVYLGRDTPSVDPAATHTALTFAMGFFGMALDRDQAQRATLTTVMDFTGPGGGASTIRVADGRCTASEERDSNADVVITQSPETFQLTRVGMLDPVSAMQTGLVKVQGLEKLVLFGELFPPPPLDRVVEPAGPPHAVV